MSAWTLGVCFGLLAYLYVGYPLLVRLLGLWLGRPVRKGPFEGSASVLIAVHNEADKLPAKLRSLLGDSGAAQVVDVWVGSDGSTDDVAAAVACVGDPRIHAVAFPERRGKPAVLNDLMARCAGDVVVMTDARQPLERGALAALLSNFADERVGVVSGELVFRTGAGDTAASRGVDAYWRYEKFIRRSESRFRSVPGATGAFYAIRRALLRPLPPDTLLDDVAIPMRAVREGYRCVFEEKAVVYDQPSLHPAAEAVRKRRTIAGNAQLVALFPWLVVPGVNPIWFEFVSHKLLRLASPFLLMGALASSWMMRAGAAGRVALALQVAFYGLAALGAWAQRAGFRFRLLGIPLMFVSLQVVTAQACWDAVRGRYRVRWTRSPGNSAPA